MVRAASVSASASAGRQPAVRASARPCGGPYDRRHLAAAAAPSHVPSEAAGPAHARWGRRLRGHRCPACLLAARGLLAFFADDLEGQPQHGSGVVHLVLAFIAFTCIAIGTILISASLMSDPAWRPSAPVLLSISIAGAIGYLLLGAALKHHHGPDGLYERIFLGLELLWLAVAAIAIARRTRAVQPE